MAIRTTNQYGMKMAGIVVDMPKPKAYEYPSLTEFGSVECLTCHLGIEPFCHQPTAIPLFRDVTISILPNSGPLAESQVC